MKMAANSGCSRSTRAIVACSTLSKAQPPADVAVPIRIWLTREAPFTEELTGAKRGDDRFLAVLGGHRELHLAAQQKVHGVRRLTLHEDGVVLTTLQRPSSPRDACQEGLPIREQRLPTGDRSDRRPLVDGRILWREPRSSF